MHPILLQFKSFTIHSDWLFISIALFVGLFIFGHLAQKSRLRLQFILDISIRLILGSLILGRIVNIVTNYQLYFSGFGLRKFLALFAIWDRNISFWGAIVGLLLVFIKNGTRSGENIKKWADIFTISFIGALCIGNIGMFLGGNNFGRPTNLPIGIVFDSAFVKYTVAIHPTQIYATIYTFILTVFLYRIYIKYKNQYDGLIFAIGLTGFSIFKFMEEMFRGDDTLTLWKLRIPMIIFFIISIYALRNLYQYQRANHVHFLNSFEKIYNKIVRSKKINQL